MAGSLSNFLEFVDIVIVHTKCATCESTVWASVRQHEPTFRQSCWTIMFVDQQFVYQVSNIQRSLISQRSKLKVKSEKTVTSKAFNYGLTIVRPNPVLMPKNISSFQSKVITLEGVSLYRNKNGGRISLSQPHMSYFFLNYLMLSVLNDQQTTEGSHTGINKLMCDSCRRPYGTPHLISGNITTVTVCNDPQWSPNSLVHGLLFYLSPQFIQLSFFSITRVFHHAHPLTMWCILAVHCTSNCMYLRNVTLFILFSFIYYFRCFWEDYIFCI